jgi:hypothetical protein
MARQGQKIMVSFRKFLLITQMLKQIMMVITVRIFETLIEASLRASNRVYKSDGTALLIPFNNWNCGKLNKRCKTVNMPVMYPHPTKHTYLDLWRVWQSFLSSPKGR